MIDIFQETIENIISKGLKKPIEYVSPTEYNRRVREMDEEGLILNRSDHLKNVVPLDITFTAPEAGLYWVGIPVVTKTAQELRDIPNREGFQYRVPTTQEQFNYFMYKDVEGYEHIQYRKQRKHMKKFKQKGSKRHG